MRLLLALAAAAPLFGQCTYTVNPMQFNIAAGSGTGTVPGSSINVAAGSGCAWGATTNTSWLHIDSGQTGSGNGTVGWHADSNTVATPRTGTLSVAGQTVSVTQAAQTCNYTLTPQTASLPVAGGSGTLSVQTACAWQASVNTNWIQIPNNPVVTGNGTVNYTVMGNPCAAGRMGAIAIATGEQLVLTQAGSAANFSFSPASESYPATTTNDRVSITTGAGCKWSAFSDVSWLAVASSSASGSGDGAITIQVLANTGGQRMGNLHINDGDTVVLLPVTQAAAAPPPVQLTVVANGADYAANAVSPGEIVGLFGSNLGPATGTGLQVSPDGLSITKTLAGVQVMFDNVAAALTYVSAGQVNAVVPYEVAGNSNGQTAVQVIYQGTASNTVTMPVVASTPGIFTISSTGQGAGAILNQDLTVNGPNNRAPRGSVVAIYCTGGGVTDPPSADASITGSSPPNLTLPVSVTIGSLNASVQYAGAAPATVAGLTQVNVVVPAGVTPGTNVPVVLTIGNMVSPAGVTLAVQ